MLPWRMTWLFKLLTKTTGVLVVWVPWLVCVVVVGLAMSLMRSIAEVPVAWLELPLPFPLSKLEMLLMLVPMSPEPLPFEPLEFELLFVFVLPVPPVLPVPVLPVVPVLPPVLPVEVTGGGVGSGAGGGK